VTAAASRASVRVSTRPCLEESAPCLSWVTSALIASVLSELDIGSALATSFVVPPRGNANRQARAVAFGKTERAPWVEGSRKAPERGWPGSRLRAPGYPTNTLPGISIRRRATPAAAAEAMRGYPGENVRRGRALPGRRPEADAEPLVTPLVGVGRGPRPSLSEACQLGGPPRSRGGS
jgi:hypothetical protein